MEYSKNEEKYPLLLVYLDESDKFTEEKSYKRSQGIAAGAAAVITRWPNDAANCWTGVCFVLLLILLFTLLGVVVTTQTHIHLVRALPKKYSCMAPKIGLFNPGTIYYTHTASKWTPQEIKTLEILLKHYNNLNATLVILQNNTKSKRSNNNSTTINSTVQVQEDSKIKIGNKLKKYKHLKIRKDNLTNFFNNTPLANIWQQFDEDVLNFASRVLLLWQNGGMSFNLNSNLVNLTIHDDNEVKNNISNSSLNNQQLTQHFIDKNGVRQRNISIYKLILFPKVSLIPKDGTTLDIEGTFMATKTLCHAFFEQILFKIKSNVANNVTLNVREIIGDSMLVFCKLGEIDTKYCDIKGKM